METSLEIPFAIYWFCHALWKGGSMLQKVFAIHPSGDSAACCAHRRNIEWVDRTWFLPRKPIPSVAYVMGLYYHQHVNMQWFRSLRHNQTWFLGFCVFIWQTLELGLESNRGLALSSSQTMPSSASIKIILYIIADPQLVTLDTNVQEMISHICGSTVYRSNLWIAKVIKSFTISWQPLTMQYVNDRILYSYISYSPISLIMNAETTFCGPVHTCLVALSKRCSCRNSSRPRRKRKRTGNPTDSDRFWVGQGLRSAPKMASAWSWVKSRASKYSTSPDLTREVTSV